jgi:hypothetical protein
MQIASELKTTFVSFINSEVLYGRRVDDRRGGSLYR